MQQGLGEQMTQNWHTASGHRRASPALPLLRKLAVVAMVGLVAVAPASAQDVKGDAAAAKDKISMCIGCHAIPGYKSSFPTVYPVPMIAGQAEKYLANALKAYRKGDRSHPSMRGIAGSLTDQDIADLAAYFTTLK